MNVLLDTCALVPGSVRKILLEAASADLFIPLWSDKIFEEWQFVASKSSEQDSEAIKIEILLIKDKWRNSLVPRDRALEDTLFLPDADDRHVLAAALVGKADVLLTNNLKDFPERILSEYGLTRKSIDSFLWELFTQEPELINSFVDRVFDLNRKKVQSALTSKKSFLKKERGASSIRCCSLQPIKNNQRAEQ